MSTVPATRNAETGGPQSQDRPVQFSEAPSQNKKALEV